MYLVPASSQGEKSQAGGPGGLPLFTRIEASLLEEQVGEGRRLLLPGQTPQTARPGNLALEASHPALSTNRQPRMSLHWFSACLSDPCPRQCGTASMEGAKPTKSESKEHSLWPLRLWPLRRCAGQRQASAHLCFSRRMGALCRGNGNHAVVRVLLQYPCGIAMKVLTLGRRQRKAKLPGKIMQEESRGKRLQLSVTVDWFGHSCH